MGMEGIGRRGGLSEMVGEVVLYVDLSVVAGLFPCFMRVGARTGIHLGHGEIHVQPFCSGALGNP